MSTRFVGSDYQADGFQSGDKQRITRTGSSVVSNAHGWFYESVKRGSVFVGSTAITGLAIPIYSGKANALTLWNPAGSGIDIALLRTVISIYSTTSIVGGICYGLVTSTGASVATGLPFATFMEATPLNAYIGSGVASKAKFANAVNTTTANPSLLQSAFSCPVFTIATHVGQAQNIVDNVDGQIVLPPGNAIQLVGSTAVAGVYVQSFIWEEIPI